MPDKEVTYFTLEDILAIHKGVMERTNFTPAPLRSRNTLEGAIMRPQTRAHYDNADLLTQGCTLIIAIAEAQAFADGNKRTAMQAGMMFLDTNGLRFTGDPELLAVLIEEAGGQPQEQSIQKLVGWLGPQME